ncbi:hypothetical protein H8S21_15240 [Erwinia persicina]|uniref:hypothetical protein n=1 Tax=Erwinia persicina TaxID=55211 RepID=UPI001654846E|nr:hypothetical protein [Erwinia persicina]MBC3946685.1 hypothetical protein [Erwinia persicina]
MGNNFGDGIDKISKNLKKIAETKSVGFGELFNKEFLAACSSFSSLEDMFEKSGFKVETPEDFKAIPDDEWESFIIKNTSYDSWEEMQSDAGSKYFQKILNDGTS